MTLMRNGSMQGAPTEKALKTWLNSGYCGFQWILASEKSMSTLRSLRSMSDSAMAPQRLCDLGDGVLLAVHHDVDDPVGRRGVERGPDGVTEQVEPIVEGQGVAVEAQHHDGLSRVVASRHCH